MIAWIKSVWAKFQAVGYAEEGNHFCPVCDIDDVLTALRELFVKEGIDVANQI